MANVSARLYWHCKTEDGWKRFPVVYAKNGRIRKGVVVVDEREKTYEQGSFHLRTLDGAKTKFKGVGTKSDEALVALEKEQKIREARQSLEGSGAEVVVPDELKTLAQHKTKFMEDVKLHNGKSSQSVYEITLTGFLDLVRKKMPSEIVKNDVLKYVKFLREEGYSDNTCFTRSRRLKRFLVAAGVKEKEIPKGVKDGLPRRPKISPEAYSEEQLDKLFSGVSKKNALIWETLLKTGLREREWMFLEPHNFDFDNRILMVRNKPHLGFRIKDNDEREIPLEEGLAKRLEELIAEQKGRRFVFGTKRDKPRRHLIRALKSDAKRLDLFCGVCDGCCTTDNCERWYLHKFRSTFATTCLQRGMDVKTLMDLLGHSDMETTLAYLAAARKESVQDKIDSIWKSSTTGKIVEMPVRRKRAS